jgi:hypothetical protein
MSIVDIVKPLIVSIKTLLVFFLTFIKSFFVSIGIDRSIALLSSVATILTAAVLFFTLRETQKQTRRAFKPDIVLSRSLFYVFWRKFGKSYLPICWTNSSLKGSSDKIADPNSLIHLEGYNIGVGAAKSIDLKWDYDIMSFVHTIKVFDKGKIFSFIDPMHSRRHSFQRFSIKSVGYELFINPDLDMKRFLDYSLPSNIKTAPIQIYFPQSFITLSSILIYLFAVNYKKRNINNKFPVSLPTLKLLMSYKDIANNIHTKEFDVSFTFCALIEQLPKTEYCSAATGIIDVVEKKYEMP